ncbi:unnamed protein product [Phyllotreta striolata]|uniref:Uncharacterized protein n=1 Tax=Phyllotreta striolata TaxID=444603 RepID=A0A9N9XLF2_PHYSR|nr:unnamed protein product [Phyllotreta striolata]
MAANEKDIFMNAKVYFKDYCKNSSIHGLKYLANQRPRLEKIWWLFSVLGIFVLCVSLIDELRLKWQNSPAIVSFVTKETPIWQIPFPVVTICPHSKWSPKRFYQKKCGAFKKRHGYNNTALHIKSDLLNFLCPYDKKFTYSNNFTESPEDILKFYEWVQPNFFNLISDCKFMGKTYLCGELFDHRIFTEEGICYAFNLLDRRDLFTDIVTFHNKYHSGFPNKWSMEHGYPTSERSETYPRRALFSGAPFALEAKLSTYEKDSIITCPTCPKGYKLTISHPLSVPRPKYDYINLPLNYLLTTTVSLDMTSTSKAASKYDPRGRNCYLSDERKLKFYKIYTQQNCQMECLTNYTLASCNCSSFFMPRELDTRICSGFDYHCVHNAELNMLDESMKENFLKLNGLQDSTKCDCMPICSNVNYILQHTYMPFSWKIKNVKYISGHHKSMFRIFFKEDQFMTFEKIELRGPIDFLANLGGILGLTAGVSVLSLVEILYYLTLRLIVNIQMFGSCNWSDGFGAE